MRNGKQTLTWIREMLRRSRSASGGSTAPQTVLVVDDEEPILRFVERVLSGAGFRTVVAHDGAEAAALASTAGPLDLLVTDLMMPHMSGDELARRLRCVEPDLPVLYLTGFSDRLFADRMQLWEREAFLDKPCSVNGLLEAVSLVSRRPVMGRLGLLADANASDGPRAREAGRTS
jgi:DNA-binding response OmpR family regulator